MNTTLQKTLAATALAVLLMPAAASAHGLGGDFTLGSMLNFGSHKEAKADTSVKIDFDHKHKDKNRDRDHKNDDKRDKIKANAAATTTAAVVTKKANRIKDAADFMTAIGATLETKLATLGTTSPAVTSATVDYKTQLAGAKTQAQAAVTAAATVNASNSTTTNASIVAQAQASLKAAREFLAAARADLMVMFKFLWK